MKGKQRNREVSPAVDLMALAECVERFEGKRVVVLGDFVADSFQIGDITRVSREAPVLILRHRQTEIVPGGGANAANNFAALGARVSPISVVGDDAAGENLIAQFRAKNLNVSGILRVKGRITPTKTRFLAGWTHTIAQQVLRVDYEPAAPLSESHFRKLQSLAAAKIKSADALAISDYGFGVVTPQIVRTLTSGLKRLIPVGCFGGAASRLLRDLAAVNPADPHDLLSLNGPWDDTVLGAVLRWAGIGRRPRIMLVHGHSDDRHELQSWLQQQDFCDVLVMQQEFGGSRTFPEKFEQVASTADGAVALATPDDAGAAADEGVLASRARQNVWLEVGWFWGHLGRDRLFLLLKGDLEVPSDLAGVEYYQYKDAPSELAKQLTEFARRLTGASIP